MQSLIIISVSLIVLVKAQALLGLDSSTIALGSLPPNELDELLDSKLEKLQLDIFRMYQDEVKLHEKTIERIERSKRQILDDPVAVLPPHDDNFGHSYTFNTGVGNREVVKIDGLDLVGYLGSLTVIDVFPMHLTNLTAIYQGKDGLGYIVIDGNLKVLMVRNEWTSSTSGCRCDGSSDPVSRSHETCACCVPGSCLCQYSLGFTGDSCVPCGTEALTCPNAATKPLELDAAVGFEFTIPETGLQRIVITAKSTIISFYEFDQYGLQIVRSVTGLSTITTAHPVTHLGYGETHVNHYGVLKKKRFLFSFSAGQIVQQFHELMVGSEDTAIAVGLSKVWQATGNAMKVSQSHGKLVITLLDGNQLHVYELKEDSWGELNFQLIQKLSLRSEIITMNTFSSGFESYLALVSDTLIRIYIQIGSYYHILSTLEVDGELTKFDNIVAISMQSCRNRIVLIVGSGSLAAVYVWDWSFTPPVLRRVNLYNLNIENAVWRHSFGYSEGQDVRLILPGPTIPSIYAVRAHLKAAEDVIWKENLVVEDTIQRFKEEYSRQNAVINAAEENLRNSIDSNNFGSDIIFLGDITITQSLTVSQTLTTNVLIANQISHTGTDMGGEEYLRQFNNTKNRLNNVYNQLDSLQSNIQGLIASGGTGGAVGGFITIINPGLNLMQLIANNLKITNIRDSNGLPFNLASILAGLVRSGNEGIQITGQKRFEGLLSIGELNTPFLDNIPTSDLVTTNSDQTIAGALFRTILYAQELKLTPGGTIAGIEVSEAVQLNEFTRLGRVIFQELEVELDLKVLSNSINGVDLQRLFQNALLLTGGDISGSLAFTGEILIRNLDISEVNGINIQNFLDSVVFKDIPAFIEGRITVGGQVVLQNLQVDGTINNRNFLENYPLRNVNGPIVFRGQKHFSNIKLGKVRFGPQTTIDGIDPDNLVTKSTNQFISGNKIFGQGVNIRGNLDIQSKISDGINLEQFVRGNTQLPTSGSFDVVFRGPITVQSISYTGFLNGLDFSVFASDILYNDGTARITGLKRFLSGLTISKAQINGLLNGDGVDSLITTSRNHVISGIKTFVQDASFTNLIAILIDGVDLNEFSNSVVYLDRNGQIIRGKKIFIDSVFISNLDLKGRLSNVDFTNVVTKSGNQVFTVAQNLNIAIFSDIEVQSIALSNGFTVNGIDISDLAARRVSLKSPVDHTGTLIIDGPISIVGNLMAGIINGVDILELQENLVMDNKDCTINGPVTISNLNVNGLVNTRFSRGANGLSLRDIHNRAAKLNEENRFTGNLNFAEIEVRADIDVTGLVNGLYLPALRDDAVYTNLDTIQTIMGTKMFLNGFHVKGDLNTLTTNGVDLSTRLFTLHTDQFILSYFSFDNILAMGNVLLIGEFNDINLKSLAASMSTGQNNYDSIRFGGNVKIGQLFVDSLFDDRNLLALFNDAIRINDGSRVTITGKKTFASSVQFRSLNVGRLNNVNLDEFFSNLILRSVDEILATEIIVNDLVSAPWITAENLVVQGALDGINYEELKNNVIYIDRQQNIQNVLIFERSIRVRGNLLVTLLNGRSLAGDYLTINTDQTITVNANFASIFSTHISVGGLVNGIFLPNLKNLTMQVIGGQVITGITTIKGQTKVLGNVIVAGRTGINPKIKLGSEVILLSSGGEINGLLRLPVPIITSTLTSSVSLINGIDVQSLFNNALFVDRSATIRARFSFTSNVIFQTGLLVSGRVDNLDVENLYGTTSIILAQFGNSTEEIKVQYSSMCNSIITLYDYLQDSLYEGDCLQFSYTEIFPERRHSSHYFQAFENSLLVLSYENRCYSEVYVWKNTTGNFGFYQSLATTGNAHGWVHVETSDGRIFIVSAASSTNNQCSDQNSTIWEVTTNSIQAVKTLVPGETVSVEYYSAELVRIHVHSILTTTAYEYNVAGGSWVELLRTKKYDLCTHILDPKGFPISFQSNGGVGEIWVGGVIRQTIQIANSIHDALLVTHHNRVILFTVVTTQNPQGNVYELRAYEIDYGNLVWLHSIQLDSVGEMSLFVVGNHVCGTVYIAINQENLLPVIYTFLNERIILWSEITVPRTTWIQYFSDPTPRFNEISNHYLIFGRDNSAHVFNLLMHGSTVPQIDYSCEIEAFTNPLLKPIVLI